MYSLTTHKNDNIFIFIYNRYRSNNLVHLSASLQFKALKHSYFVTSQYSSYFIL